MMGRRYIGLITVAAVLGGLLLGLAVSRLPAAGQDLPAMQGPFTLRPSSNLLRSSDSANADASLNHTINTTGVGEVKAKPDVAYVTVGVDTQANTAAAAQQQNADQMAAVVNAIKGLQVADSDIQTSGITLQPIFDTNRSPGGTQGQITGYRATNSVTVRLTDISKAGPVLDTAVNAGANVESSIRFTIANDSDLRQQALKKAVQDARGKADAIASALGVSISGVHSAGEGSISVPPIVQNNPRPMAAVAPQAATPVEPGELTITAQVTVVYTY